MFKNIDYQRISNNASIILAQIKRQAMVGTKETSKMMLELYYVMLSEKTSKFNKIVIGAAFAYQFLPNDFLSKEEYGILGYLDNATILYFAYKRVKKSVSPEISQKVEETMNSWLSSVENFTILKPENERI
ncbi:MAG: DUF1232 domain-containing protein [Lactobacillus sp.]|nr:DUF1232 domain-containing protein [Lactobacillus sp.]